MEGKARKPYSWRKMTAAVVMSAGLIGVFYADYLMGVDLLVNVLMMAIVLKGLSEFYRMCDSRHTGPFKGFGLFAGGMLVVFNWIATPGTVEWFGERFGFDAMDFEPLIREELVRFGLVVAVLGALWLQATKRDNDRTFESISSTLFGILYLWFLPSFIIKLGHLGRGGHLGGEDWHVTGVGLVISMLMVSKLADVGGYLVGTKFGRTKLIPRISPNKTWEGLAAGEILSVGAALALWHFGFLPFAQWWSAVIFGFVVSGMGVLGDLAASLLKRGAGYKDSGALVPGFGGVLDVVDSIIVSAPVAYFLALLFLRAGF